MLIKSQWEVLHGTRRTTCKEFSQRRTAEAVMAEWSEGQMGKGVLTRERT